MGILGKIFASKDKKYERLVDELINLGYANEVIEHYSSPAYLIEKGPDNVEPCPRARAIGLELHEMGGIELMRKAAERVEAALGSAPVGELSSAWHKVGDWMH